MFLLECEVLGIQSFMTFWILFVHVWPPCVCLNRGTVVTCIVVFWWNKGSCLNCDDDGAHLVPQLLPRWHFHVARNYSRPVFPTILNKGTRARFSSLLTCGKSSRYKFSSARNEFVSLIPQRIQDPSTLTWRCAFWVSLFSWPIKRLNKPGPINVCLWLHYANFNV